MTDFRNLFKPQDIKRILSGVTEEGAGIFCKHMQTIINKALDGATVIYGRNEGGVLTNFSSMSDKIGSVDTHKGIIINIEKLECQHRRTKIWEPHLAGARKCLDCEMVLNPNRTPNWQLECVEHKPKEISSFTNAATGGEWKVVCKYCGAALVATWRVDE